MATKERTSLVAVTPSVLERQLEYDNKQIQIVIAENQERAITMHMKRVPGSNAPIVRSGTDNSYAHPHLPLS